MTEDPEEELQERYEKEKQLEIIPQIRKTEKSLKK